jgi:hypothetical protein
MHVNEDKLLQYALEASPTDAERVSIAEHLAICSECSARLEEIRKDIEIIGGVQPRRQELRIPGPRPRHNFVYPVIRAAALFIFGPPISRSHRPLILSAPTSFLMQPRYQSVTTSIFSKVMSKSLR